MRRLPKQLVGSVAVVGFLAAGCASEGSGITTANTDASSSTTATTVAASLADRYLAVAEENNAKLRPTQIALAQLVGSAPDLEPFRPLLAQGAAIIREGDKRIEELPWPPSLEADVADLLAANAKIADGLDEMASAERYVAICDACIRIRPYFDGQTLAAARLRADLGLPPRISA